MHTDISVHLIVVTQARVVCLMASGVHIRQATSACVTTIMYHFPSELTQQLKLRVRSICGDCIYSVACEFRL